MILSPAQTKTLQDSYALGVFLQSDPAFNEQAQALASLAAELLDIADRLEEQQELTAPF